MEHISNFNTPIAFVTININTQIVMNYGKESFYNQIEGFIKEKDLQKGVYIIYENFEILKVG